ncbi:type IV toxin-antitoxin system AbiEi family antitoxin domain-containing protein [Phycicoccus sonneratiae]|uniref:Type IV toxin-antitoxin system AbiEi family antitoxin domain-containing protein n=1 Tax=Phycicoccus sonneratiae TaxID=2807628 RepID=A0ABS2CQZ5_9MICO|nr:type IV toxin-antitoxin system AbiEi family antitoxin domain-containing protein [Phycicoccus sonneraticus]MBM6402301.1 type IV toxin-antitoxin system AbiEi family antitoxin domain-containing protein [Phycicoccus sonneraticus]
MLLLPRLLALPQPFFLDDAAQAHLSRHQVTREVEREVLTRLHRGLYAVTDTWHATPPWDQHLGLVHAAHRAHPGYVTSHVSAARLHGLPLPGRRLPQAVLTVDDDSTTSGHEWLDLRRGELPGDERTTLADIDVTTIPRTVVDCARSLRLPEAVAIADAALRAGRCTADDLVRVRRGQRRWPGVTRADVVFAHADPRRESWLESASAVTFHSWGVPLGVPQVDVFSPDGEWLARVDVAWASLGVVGEADGRGKFLGAPELGLGDVPADVARRLLRSHDRAESLRGLGLQVVRWTSQERASSPRTVVARWHRAVAAAAASSHRAVFRCSCCRLPPTDCEFDRFPGLTSARRAAQLARSRVGRGWGQTKGERTT